MNDENNKEPQDKAVDEEVAREMEGVPEHLRDDGEAADEDDNDAIVPWRHGKTVLAQVNVCV